MKKTLIALAAVAVAGAASAQVTLSGNVGFGYETTNSGSGFGADSAKLVFSASEDLGGGLKASAMVAIDNLQDDGVNAYANAKGAMLALSGGFGKVTMASTEGGDAVKLDSLLGLGNGTKGSIIGYTSPSFSGVTVSATRKSGSGPESAGASGNNGSLMIYGLKYAEGPIAAGVSLLSWNDQGVTGSGLKGRTTITASYDFGMAKVGVFTSTQKFNAASTASNDAGVYSAAYNGASDSSENVTNTAFQVSAPVGPLSIAYEHGVMKQGSISNKGDAFSIGYALSKRTSVDFWSKTWKLDNNTTENHDAGIAITHSF